VFSRICDNSPRNTVSTRKRYFAIGDRKGTAKDTRGESEKIVGTLW
jgi:hypothetical protein